jgi:hypothetical protein
VPQKPNPADTGAIVSVERERERTIAALSEHFANDTITLEELERRIGLAYQASSLPALREITSDLTLVGTDSAERGAVVRGDVAPETDRITAFLSRATRKGVWRPARRVDVWSIMAETRLNLTQAVFSPGVTEIRLRGLMTQIKVVVPPGVRVVLQADAFLSEVADDTLDPPAIGSGAPVVRITGGVVMSELVVLVRQPSE